MYGFIFLEMSVTTQKVSKESMCNILTDVDKIEFQVCSDVHLEENPGRTFEEVITPKAPILILAGDIGDPGTIAFQDFIRKCSEAFKKVYFVPGNHEYHGHGIVLGTLKMQKVFALYDNVTCLQCSKEQITDGVVIIGATMWTHIPVQLHLSALKAVGDYQKMDKSFTPATCNIINRQHKDWLANTIREEQDKGSKLIIVTHHPPSMHGTSPPSFCADTLRFCYRNNLDHLISLSGNIAWIAGHTHYSYNLKRGKALLSSNQVCSKTYNKDLVFAYDVKARELNVL